MAQQVTPELEQSPPGIGAEVEQARQSDPIAEAAEARQPDKPKEDLTANEQFRRWQAEMDKKLAAERKERERLERQYQQQLAAQQQQLEERQLSGMDDYQRAQYERDKAIQEATYWREQAAMIQTQTARERELGTIAQKFSVPREVLEEATSRAEALELAFDYREKQQQEQARAQAEESEERKREREQKKLANQVDTGSGIGSSPKTDFERDYEKALKSGSSQQLAKFLIAR